MATTVRWLGVAALLLQAACSSGGGIDGAAMTDAADDRADVPTASDVADDRADVASGDAGDGPSGDATDGGPEAGTDAGGGCGDGVWSTIPAGLWSNISYFDSATYPNDWDTAWAVTPATFLYFKTQGSDGLRRFDGTRIVKFPTQPPPGYGSTIRGSGENDVWLRAGVLQRAGVTDRVEVPATRWDGAAWNALTLTIPVSPPLAAAASDAGHGAASALWSVAPGEAWIWVQVYDAQNSATQPYAPYHFHGGAWERVPSPLDAIGPSAVPSAAWSSSPTDVWVGGSLARTVPPTGDASAPTTAYDPLLLHWDGAQWTQVSLPIASGNGNRRVTALSGSAPNDVSAVGRTDTSADTWHFDGAQWTEIPVAGPATFNLVAGSCPGDAWAISGNGPQGSTGVEPWRVWRFDGTAWSQVSLPAGMISLGYLTGTGAGGVWLKVLTVQTCTPYEQGPLPTMLHWGPNRCGDGVVAGGETCDPPRSVGDGLRCDQTCQRPRCGNGVVDTGEDCDPPNRGDGLQCDETCHRPSCGNGIVEAGEGCDPPMSGTCDAQCQPIPVKCGDGIIEPGEICDALPDDNRGLLCGDCKTQTCAEACFEYGLNDPYLGSARCDYGQECYKFHGADFVACQELLLCLMRNGCGFKDRYRVDTPVLGCFCGGSCTPSSGDGACSAQTRALLARVQPDLDTSDPVELFNQASGKTLIYRLVEEATAYLSVEGHPCTTFNCVGSPY